MALPYSLFLFCHCLFPFCHHPAYYFFRYPA
jgi:hypothetical protein